MLRALAALVASGALVVGVAEANKGSLAGPRTGWLKQRVETSALRLKRDVRRFAAERRIGWAKRQLEKIGMDEPMAVGLTSKAATREIAGSLAKQARRFRGGAPGSKKEWKRQRLQDQQDMERQWLFVDRLRIDDGPGGTTSYVPGEEMRVDVELEFAERENLLQILAHEFQHVRDWRPLVKLQREITALRSLESPTPETLKLLARKERQAQKLAGRMPRERMEVRAYRAGEYALAVSGYGPGGAHMPGGLPPGDPSYPAATIALAAIDGYLAGASRLIADGRPLTDRARAYLKGYRRAMLEQTAWAFEHPPTDKEFRDGVRASLRTARLGAVTRRLVTKEAKRLADRTRQTFGSVATPDDAFAAGWRDAYQWRPAAGRAANLR